MIDLLIALLFQNRYLVFSYNESSGYSSMTTADPVDTSNGKVSTPFFLFAKKRLFQKKGGRMIRTNIQIHRNASFKELEPLL